MPLVETETLNDAEQAALTTLESTIEKGLSTFHAVGAALSRIRDNRLYRTAYKTFEDYCQDRWGMVASRARQLIAAAEVATNIESVTTGNTLTERAMRPLTKLKPDQQREAWAKAVDTAPEGKMTAAHVEQTVEDFKVEISFDNPPPSRILHDRTPTMHGGLVIYWTMLRSRKTTSQWAEYLGLTYQGAARILENLASEHDFSFAPDHEGRWTIYVNGEPF